MSQLGQSRRRNRDGSWEYVRFASESGQIAHVLGLSALCHKRTNAPQQKSTAIRSPRRHSRNECTEYWIGTAAQSGLMLAARITSRHFSV